MVTDDGGADDDGEFHTGALRSFSHRSSWDTDVVRFKNTTASIYERILLYSI